MKSADQYIDEIRQTPRPIKRQHYLQQASNELPPHELGRLYGQLDKIGGRELCALAPEYRYFTSGARLRQLTAQKPVGATQLYTSEGGKPEKRLYILFSGDTGQFFLPLAVVLDLLPKGPKDVVVIRSGHGNFFRFGVAGLGVPEYQVASALRDKFSTGDYRHVSVMGFSAGGFYALKIAELLDARIALSFAGVVIDNTPVLARLQRRGGTAFDPVCHCRKQPDIREINVVATKNEADCFASIQMQKRRPRLINYHLVMAENHNVLGRLFHQKIAHTFFKAALNEQNGLPIRLFAFPFYGIAMFIRRTRLLFGRQKKQLWYEVARKQ